MRDLSPLETGYLATLLMLSLVLPLQMSFYRARNDRMRKPGKRIVWIGQSFGAIAGILVLASPTAAPYATVLGLLSCLTCAPVLHRRFREMRTA